MARALVSIDVDQHVAARPARDKPIGQVGGGQRGESIVGHRASDDRLRVVALDQMRFHDVPPHSRGHAFEGRRENRVVLHREGHVRASRVARAVRIHPFEI